MINSKKLGDLGEAVPSSVSTMNNSESSQQEPSKDMEGNQMYYLSKMGPAADVTSNIEAQDSIERTVDKCVDDTEKLKEVVQDEGKKLDSPVIPPLLLIERTVPFLQRDPWIRFALTNRDEIWRPLVEQYQDVPPWPPEIPGEVLRARCFQEIYSIDITSTTMIPSKPTRAFATKESSRHLHHDIRQLYTVSMEMAIACGNNMVYVWNPSCGPFDTKHIELVGHALPVVCVSYSTKRQPWSLGRNALDHNQSGDYDITRLPSVFLLASSSIDGTIRLWDVNSHYSCQQVLRGHEGSVNAVAFVPKSNDEAISTHFDKSRAHHEQLYLVSGSSDRTVRIWNAINGSCVRILSGHVGTIFAVAIPPKSPLADSQESASSRKKRSRNEDKDGNGLPRLLASGSVDGTVRVWDLSALSSLSHFQQEEVTSSFNSNDLHTAWVRSIAISPDGMYMASGKDDFQIRIYDISSENYKKIKRENNLEQGQENAPRQRQGYQLLRGGHNDCVMAVSFSPVDSQTLVSGSRDETVRLWNVANGRCLATLDVREKDDGRRSSRINHPAMDSHPIFAVAFSPDGRYVVSSGADYTIRIWNVSNIC